MKIHSAQFIKSATDPRHYPEGKLPEVAFAGRSNVGKSSLINALVGRKRLAQTSSTPGRTRLLNFFEVNSRISLVDLPGYGFAKVSREMKKQWGRMVEGYLRRRTNLRLVIVIIDSRRELSADDCDLFEWLRAAGIPFLPVLTKSDKVSRSEAKLQAKKIGSALALPAGGEPVIFSAKTGEGKDRIWAEIKKKVSSSQFLVPS